LPLPAGNSNREKNKKNGGGVKDIYSSEGGKKGGKRGEETHNPDPLPCHLGRHVRGRFLCSLPWGRRRGEKEKEKNALSFLAATRKKKKLHDISFAPRGKRKNRKGGLRAEATGPQSQRLPQKEEDRGWLPASKEKGEGEGFGYFWEEA